MKDLVEFEFTPAGRQQWTRRLSAVPSPYTQPVPPPHVPAFARQIRDRREPMTDGHELLAAAARAAADDLLADAGPVLAAVGEAGGPALAVIRHVPTDRPHPDLLPVDGCRNPARPTAVTEIVTLAALCAGGHTPVSFLDEAGPELLMPLHVHPRYRHTQSSRGGAALGFHADNAYFPREYRPDVLVLTGQIASEPAVATTFSPLRPILRVLDRDRPRELEALFQSRFRFRSPASFHPDGSAQRWSEPGPILGHDEGGDTVIRYSEYNVAPADPGDDGAAAAIRALNAAAAAPGVAIPVVIGPGVLVLASNTKALHARGAVNGQRYLIRGYGKKDLGGLRGREAGSDRILRYRFSLADQLGTAAATA